MSMFYELPMVNLSDEEMLEKEKIRELVEYERYCCDNRHKEEQKSLWFPDGEIFTTWFKGKFLDYCTASPVKGGCLEESEPESEYCYEPMNLTSHKINNTVVWLKDTRAIAELLCSLNFRTKIEKTWVDIQCFCRMHYRVEKRDGFWGIVYFEGIYEKDSLKPVFGDDGFMVPRDVLRKYRPNNWNMAVRRDVYEGGAEYADEWAGPDRPETIQKLYCESSKWIYMEE